jgi:cell wall-associated NlpC family hydrolase
VGEHRAPPPPWRAGKVGAAVGLGLTAGSAAFAPAPAAASPSVDWDRVAECESSGDWAVVDASGHHGGGLQFTDSTWRAYGGRGEPEAASRGEQIAVAERVLVGQGIGAWPVCGPRGVGGSPRNPAAGSGVVPRETSPRTSATSPPTSPRASTRPRAQRPPEHPVTSPPRTDPRTDPSTHYRVRRGDTLSGIAAELRVQGGFPALARANAIDDVDLIRPGQDLEIPAGPSIQGLPPRLSPSSAPAGAATAEPVTGAITTDVITPTRRRAGAPTSHAPSASESVIVATARQWIGAPYRWGGTTRRDGVDCSGLVQAVFRANGTILPRTAGAQLAATTRITRDQARPGDLVGNRAGTHIGIFIGHNQMIDAPHRGARVGVHPLYRDMTVFGRVS